MIYVYFEKKEEQFLQISIDLYFSLHKISLYNEVKIAAIDNIDSRKEKFVDLTARPGPKRLCVG